MFDNDTIYEVNMAGKQERITLIENILGDVNSGFQKLKAMPDGTPREQARAAINAAALEGQIQALHILVEGLRKDLSKCFPAESSMRG